ncbi:hypothetical protein GF352_00335 [archaeon]|nr:hypothetical protein [archaeon]
MAKKSKKNSAPARVIVIDVLKPHKPNILELGKAICEDKSVINANISVYAIDEKTENVKITIDGKDINYDKVKGIIDEHGAVIHSLDKVVLGRKKPIEVPKIDK